MVDRHMTTDGPRSMGIYTISSPCGSGELKLINKSISIVLNIFSGLHHQYMK